MSGNRYRLALLCLGTALFAACTNSGLSLPTNPDLVVTEDIVVPAWPDHPPRIPDHTDPDAFDNQLEGPY